MHMNDEMIEIIGEIAGVSCSCWWNSPIIHVVKNQRATVPQRKPRGTAEKQMEV